MSTEREVKLPSDIQPVASLNAAAIEELRGALRGRLLRPGDDGYDQARVVFNAMIDRRPGLIARCAGVADVIKAVAFARRHRLLVAVRGGGHHVSGNAVCDDGMVIDLSTMKGVRIDPAARTVQAEPGLTWGELNHDLQAFGLGATGGYVSITGIPGLTLGGGFGWLVRKYGLALDNLLSVDMVTAESQLLRVSAKNNEELFWGMRGAGANFGVVTNFEFRVHPVGTVLSGAVIHPFARAKEVLRMVRDRMTDAPDDLTWGTLLFTIPASPMFPLPLHNAPVIAITLCWAGPIAAGEAYLRPIREFGPPLADLVHPTPFNVAQLSADFVWPPGHRGYWKSSFLRELSDESIDTIIEHFARVPSNRTVVVLDHNGGGAISRVGATETAFGHRNLIYNFLVTSGWERPRDDDKNIDWTRTFWSAMRPYAADAIYGNYTSDLGGDVLDKVYVPSVRQRLIALKNKYDPTNLFRMNHNLQPTI